MSPIHKARPHNFFSEIPAELDARQELIEEIVRGAGVRVERIVSTGQASPRGYWYDQGEHEWVMVLEGRAGIEIEGSEAIVELGPGDYIDLPAHCRHRVAWTASTERTVWLAVFFSSSSEASTDHR